MVYINKKIMSCISSILIFLLLTAYNAYCQEHIRKMDAVRTSMSKVGNILPELTRKAQGRDIRMMERVFEINNYSLVTMESYFKMIKIALASGTGLNKEVLGVLNGWLRFITNYSEYDIKYIDEALSQTTDPALISILKSERDNISSLRDVSKFGIEENTATSNKLGTSSGN